MTQIKKTIAGLLVATLVLNQLAFFVPEKALAASASVPVPVAETVAETGTATETETLGIIALMVDRGLLNDGTQYRAKYSHKSLSEHLKTFAEDIQTRLPHTKAIIVRVDPADAPFKISQALEKLYFEGDSPDTNSRLIGVIAIGNVPLPVVYGADGTSQVSIYPYVDFYQKRFVYNHATDRFEEAGEDPPAPEVWHGLIKPPKQGAEGVQLLAEYFDKNHQYSIGNPEYSQFENRVLVSDFVNEIKQFNAMDYRNYLRYAKLLPEMVYKRFNRHLLTQVIQEVSRELSPDTPPSQITPVMDAASIRAIPDTQTETIIRKYTVPLPDALKTYLGKLNRLVEVSGRWDSARVDSPASLISARDIYTAYLLRGLNDGLEKKVNDAIDQAARPQDILNSVALELRVRPCPTLNLADPVCGAVSFSGRFSYLSYLDGQKVADIKSVAECGLLLGQKGSGDGDVLKNNSVPVEANRMYNPRTIVKPDEDENPPETRAEYKDYAGCVANNMTKPEKCFPGSAVLPLLDILGSRETSVPASQDIMDADRCKGRFMSFRSADDSVWERPAIQFPIPVPPWSLPTLRSIIDDAYGIARSQQFIEPAALPTAIEASGSYNHTTANAKASALIRAILEKKAPFNYQILPGVFLELNVIPVLRPIASALKHNEPTEAHYRAIKASMVTSSLPADGVHYTHFKTAAGDQRFDHVDLFRIRGTTPQEVSANFLAAIQKKNDELNQLLGASDDVIVKFFLDHADVIEPILWQNLSLDQKHIYALDKYLNQNTSFPAPEGQGVPQYRPDGYEALYINAPQGDARGFRYQIHGSILGKDTEPPKETPPADATPPAPPADDSEGENRDSHLQATGSSRCGDMTGVEIWKWFDAVQCWLTEEVLPAEKLFSMDNACSAAPSPEVAEASFPAENIDPIDDTADTPARVNAVMERQTLVSGSEEPVGVQILNDKNEVIPGFLEDEIQASVSPADLGSFTQSSVRPDLGSASFKFKANKIGEGKLKFVYHAFSQEIAIKVVDTLALKLYATSIADPRKVGYKVRVELLDGDGKPVTNVRASLHLSALHAMDGVFDREGKVDLRDGAAETVFYPSPARPEIDLIAEGDSYKTGTVHLKQPPNRPDRILLQPRPFVRINQRVSLPMEVVDVNGVAVRDFNGVIQVKVTDATKRFGTVASEQVTVQNGKGAVIIRTSSTTGPLDLVASFPGIKDGAVEIPVVAGLTSDQLGYLDGNDLFAAFEGFPAGDFTQDGYFGGVHLFRGKTEAVYSSMKNTLPPPAAVIHSNGFFELQNSAFTLHPNVINGELYLQLSGNKTLREILSAETPFRFSGAELLSNDDSASLKENAVYLELLDSSNRAEEIENGFRVVDKQETARFTLTRDNLTFQDSTLRLIHEPKTERSVLTLSVVSGAGAIANILLNFPSQRLNPNGFDVPNPWQLVPAVSGRSTNDPKGLALIDSLSEPPSWPSSDTQSGWKGDQKYMLLFAAGNTIGDSVKYHMPVEGILLGDPTIRLATARSSTLPYDGAVGRKIYQDPKGAGIKAMTPIDFNRDGEMDVVAVLSDGRVRLLEGGSTEPPLRDRGDIAFLADKAIAVMSVDDSKDSYPDLLIATDAGRLALLNNDREVLTRTNKLLRVGKKVYQILKEDMDADGRDDLVTLDSRGDIRIFYGGDAGIPENGTLIGNYGFHINTTDNLSGDLKIRYPGMPEPDQNTRWNSDPTKSISGPLPDDINQALNDFMNSGQAKAIDPAVAGKFLQGQAEAKAIEAQGGDSAPPKLPWADNGDAQSFFTPVSRTAFLRAEKTVQNKERPSAADLDLGETLLYTIRLRSNRSLSDAVVADTVPDALQIDPKSVECAPSCGKLNVQNDGTLLFLGNLKLPAGQEVSVTYSAKVVHTPKANILLKKLENPNDSFIDIVVSPPYNNTGQLIEHYSTAPRVYAVRATPPPAPEEDPVNLQAAAMERCKVAMASVDPNNPNLDAALAACGLKDIIKKQDDGILDTSGQTGKDPDAGGCSANSVDDAEACANAALDSVIDGINNFACMGSACFPMPLNMSFMVPGNKYVPFVFPVLAFPTTLYTTVGPIPFLWPPSYTGATDTVSPIMSNIRLYMSPTLTGGMGVALCWGPYAGNYPVPPPLMPIPYPPPLGNCIVNALPMGDFPICKEIERGITRAMDAANSVVNDVKSGIAAVTNKIPGMEAQGGDEQAAGGLEVSLAVQLGNKRKFNAPAKGFTNRHISTFDSIGGALSSWWDRELTEIVNKLLLLPNIKVILPDFGPMVTPDMEAFNKNFTALKNTFTGIATETAKRTDEIWNEKETKNDKSEATEKDSGAQKLFKHWQALDTSISAYNANVFEQIYDLLSSIPFVHIRETPIDFKIPFLSPQQIRVAILESRQWVEHMKNELDRVKVLWDKNTCPVSGDAYAEMTKEDLLKQKSKCVARNLADKFIVDMEGTIKSVQDNIDVFQSYLRFPRKVVKFKAELADYVRQLGCILRSWGDLLGGWQSTVREQLVSYATFAYTVKAIVKNIKKIVDIFNDFQKDCDLCTNERTHNYGWFSLLGMVLPEIPIIKFPKWPDLTIDLSESRPSLNIELPSVHFIGEAITLPRLPSFHLPDVPDLNMFLQLPMLPVLPAIPELPDLPALPAIPTVNLPTLPPPPKLPDVGKRLGSILSLVQKILKIWCLAKKALSPIPEAMLADEISLLTERPSYLIPLDLLKPKSSDIAPVDLGFNELKVKVRVQLGLRLKGTLETMEKAAKDWNESITDLSGYFDAYVQEYLKGYAQKMQNYLDAAETKINEKFAALEQVVNKNVQGKLLDKAQENLNGIQSTLDQTQQFLKDQSRAATDWLQKNTSDKAAQGTSQGIDAANQAIRDAETKLNQALDKANPTDAIEKGINDLQNKANDLENKIKEKITPSDKQSQSSLSQALALFKEINQTVIAANQKSVDYRELKEQLGVPDIHFAPKAALSYKISGTVQKLHAFAGALNRETKGSVEDLRLLAKDSPPRFESPYRLASSETPSSPPSGPQFDLPSSPPSELPFGQQSGPQLDPLSSLPASGQSGCVGSCLLDPATQQMVTFVSYADDFGSVQTIFVPAKNSNKTNVVYNDGSSIYLKQDLTIPADLNNNMPSRFFGPEEYDLNDLMPQGESLNYMTASIQGNQASQLSWAASTNPGAYGVIVQVKKTIDGFDANRQDNGISDLAVVLMPVSEDGPPAVLADGQPVDFGTLLVRESDAESAFPVKYSQLLTGVKTIRFPAIGKVINLKPGHAILIDEYQGDRYELKAKNGFYYAKSSWFDREGRMSVANQNEVLAPQIYGETGQPIAVAPDDGFFIPLFKRKTLRASDIFADLTGAYQYAWDINQDGLPDKVGNEITLDPQSTPKEFSITVTASFDLQDPQFKTFKRAIKVTIYTPGITLEDTPLKERGEAKGVMTPKDPMHDLKSIPFSIFRQRWNVWKNLGRSATKPPQDQTGGYWTVNEKGEYRITGLNTTDKRVVVRDIADKDIAYVLPDTGQIQLVDSVRYYSKPLPADETHPTRVGIFANDTNGLMANVYFVPDGNTDVTILSEGVDQENGVSIGVTIGDRDVSDDIIARTIPGFAPTYPGGAAIFNNTEQKNIALINSWGALRFMQPGYRLILKNPDALTERSIFTITDESGQPLFDVFIATDFTQPTIHQNETWPAPATIVGTRHALSLRPNPAGHVMSNDFTAHAAEISPSPFPDVPADHPQFKAIKDLYDRRIIQGYGDGTFRPDAKISRGEFVKIALGGTHCLDCTMPTLPQRQKYGIFAPFPDVIRSAWYYFCVWIGKELKMITGYGDGLFRPEQNISRAEAAAILLRQSNIAPEKNPNQEFFDVPAYAWYRDYVNTAVKIGLIKNNAGFVFPDQEITRGEFAFMADLVVNTQDCKNVDSDKDGMPDSWEMRHGLDPVFAGDARQDNDHDGFTNLQEFQAGTDPNQAQGGTGSPAAAGEGDLISPPDKGGSGGLPKDLCPEIPEDADSIDDTDGCPELVDNVPITDPGVYVNNGALCGTLLDYMADLWPGDKIMTAITDLETHETIFSQSKEISY